MVWIFPDTIPGFLKTCLCLTLDGHETTPPYPMLRRGERSNDWVSGRVSWTEELEQAEMVTLDLNGETRISQ